LCLNFLNHQTNISKFFKKGESLYLCLILIVLSGLPPFPLFYTKIVVILFLVASGLNFYLLIFFMIGVMFIIVGYIKQVFELFFIVGGSPSFFLLK
jgi:NADH:ubiquinone oxidoreductase subunit 2 (subunit N)